MAYGRSHVPEIGHTQTQNRKQKGISAEKVKNFQKGETTEPYFFNFRGKHKNKFIKCNSWY